MASRLHALGCLPLLLILQGEVKPRLSLHDLIDRALNGNHALTAQSHRIHALEFNSDQKLAEASWHGWELSLEGDYYPGTSFSSKLSGVEERLALSVAVPLFGSKAERDLGSQAVDSELAVVRGEYDDLKRQTLSALVGHYVTYSRGFAIESSLTLIESRQRERARIVEARERAGESLLVDLHAVNRDLAELQLRRERNREAMEVALDGLREAVGDLNLPNFDPMPMPWEDFERKVVPPLDSIANRAILSSQEIQGLRKKAASLKEQSERTEDIYPKSYLSAGYVGQRTRDSEFENGPAVSIYFSIPLGYSRIRNDKKNALIEERARILSEIDRKSHEIASKVRARYQELLGQKEQIRFADSQLRLAGEQERVARLQSESLPDNGEKSLVLQRLDAEINHLEAKAQRESTAMGVASSYIKMLVDLGESSLLDDVVSVPVIPKGVAVWLWDDRVLADHRELDKFLETSRKWMLGAVFLSLKNEERTRWMDAQRGNPQRLKDFVSRCHNLGMRVEFLLSDNEWVFTENRAGFESTLKEFQAFQASANDWERFDGLHLDIEPHSLSAWKSDGPMQQALIRNYLELLQLTKLTQLPVTADIPTWYRFIEFDNTNLTQKILEKVDAICLMNYRTELANFVEEAQANFQIAEPMKKKVLVGVSAERLLPPTQGFHSWPLLADQLHRSVNSFRREPSFVGFAVQGYRDFEELLP